MPERSPRAIAIFCWILASVPVGGSLSATSVASPTRNKRVVLGEFVGSYDDAPAVDPHTRHRRVVSRTRARRSIPTSLADDLLKVLNRASTRSKSSGRVRSDD